MKIRLKRILTLILVAVCVANSSQSTTAPFTLTLEAEENLVKAGSEVKVDITLRNSSSREMYISYGLSELDYAFEVRDSQNRIPPETEFARKSKGKAHFWNDQIFTLQPGESLPKAVLVLTKFYNMSHAGQTTVQVSRVVPKELGGGTIKSNTITISVTE
jgi:hypothetical protein